MEALQALLFAVAGAALKALWDAYVDKKKTLEIESWKIRTNELEKRLSQFYWPIYLRLQRDNVVWRRILERENQTDEMKRRLGDQIEQGVLLPNHQEIMKIIETNIHLAALDKQFEEVLMAYVRHVDVFRSLRAVGIADDPIHFDEPYPKLFFQALEERLHRFQKQYESMLSEQGVGAIE